MLFEISPRSCLRRKRNLKNTWNFTRQIWMSWKYSRSFYHFDFFHFVYHSKWWEGESERTSERAKRTTRMYKKEKKIYALVKYRRRIGVPDHSRLSPTPHRPFPSLFSYSLYVCASNDTLSEIHFPAYRNLNWKVLSRDSISPISVINENVWKIFSMLARRISLKKRLKRVSTDDGRF